MGLRTLRAACRAGACGMTHANQLLILHRRPTPRATNVAFFLTPKSEVVWVSASGTLEQALERMRPNGFSAVPILDDEGCYVGTLSTSDLIWYLLGADRAWQGLARSTPLISVPRRVSDTAVHIDAEIPELRPRRRRSRDVHRHRSPATDHRVLHAFGSTLRAPQRLACTELLKSAPHSAFTEFSANARATNRATPQPARTSSHTISYVNQ
ncbi:MAG: CBS domain-containing protein [Polyangiaceae bacterium]